MQRTTSPYNRNFRIRSGRFLVYFVMLVLLICLCFILRSIFVNSPRVSNPNNSANHISPLFTDSVQYWNEDIQRWAAEYDLDPNLIATVMQIESCGNPTVVSGAGAMGLFQVMPFHFYAEDDPFDPETNAVRGLEYLRESYAQSGKDAAVAMAGYNGGIGVIALPYDQWYEETQRYHYWGSLIYQAATNGESSTTAIDDWMNVLGRTMCSNAEDQLGSLP